MLLGRARVRRRPAGAYHSWPCTCSFPPLQLLTHRALHAQAREETMIEELKGLTEYFGEDFVPAGEPGKGTVPEHGGFMPCGHVWAHALMGAESSG